MPRVRPIRFKGRAIKTGLFLEGNYYTDGEKHYIIPQEIDGWKEIGENTEVDIDSVHHIILPGNNVYEDEPFNIDDRFGHKNVILYYETHCEDYYDTTIYEKHRKAEERTQ